MNLKVNITKAIKMGVVGLILSSILSVPSFAGHNHHDRHKKDKARVLSVKGIYERVRVRQNDRYCGDHRHDPHINHQIKHNSKHRNEQRNKRKGNRHSYNISPITGAIIGSAIGHQFGSGSGNKAATITGAIVGSVIAHEASSNNKRYSHQTRRPFTSNSCKSKHGGPRYVDELVGYKVKYKYKGRIYKTRTRHHPGKFITIANSRKRH